MLDGGGEDVKQDPASAQEGTKTGWEKAKRPTLKEKR